MRTIVKLLVALAFGAALTGCVVAPIGPRPYARVAVIAPAVLACRSGMINASVVMG